MAESDRVTDEDYESEGIPDLDAPIPSKVATGDAQEGLLLPRNRPVGANEFGTTADEESRGESLDRRVRREQPDIADDEGSEEPFDDESATRHQAGRLLGTDIDAGAPDDEKDVATEVDDRAGLSSEEEAVRVEEGL